MLMIWHNPRCSKSRQTLALLEASNMAFTVRRYLEDHPNREEIGSIITQIGLSDPTNGSKAIIGRPPEAVKPLLQ